MKHVDDRSGRNKLNLLIFDVIYPIGICAVLIRSPWFSEICFSSVLHLWSNARFTNRIWHFDDCLRSNTLWLHSLSIKIVLLELFFLIMHITQDFSLIKMHLKKARPDLENLGVSVQTYPGEFLHKHYQSTSKHRSKFSCWWLIWRWV